MIRFSHLVFAIPTRLGFALTLALFAWASIDLRADWPGLLGANRDGHASPDSSLPLTLPRSPNCFGN